MKYDIEELISADDINRFNLPLPARDMLPVTIEEQITELGSNLVFVQGSMMRGGPGGGMGSQMEGEFKPSFYFYDLNGKLTLTPSQKDVFTFSFYSGKDDLDALRRRIERIERRLELID